MITKGEKSLDMLQCILVHNIWYVSLMVENTHCIMKQAFDLFSHLTHTNICRSYYFSATSPQSQSTGMMQLSLALLFDLGLNRGIPDDDAAPTEPLRDYLKQPYTGDSLAEEKKRTLEERRALLFCYLASSV